MKYYIKNYKKTKNGDRNIPSQLMDKFNAISLFIKLRKEFVVSTRELPVLCNENGEEMDGVLHVLAGEKVHTDAYLVHVELTDRLSGKFVDYYYTNGNNPCSDGTSALLDALIHAERDKSYNFVITKLELVF